MYWERCENHLILNKSYWCIRFFPQADTLRLLYVQMSSMYTARCRDLLGLKFSQKDPTIYAKSSDLFGSKKKFRADLSTRYQIDHQKIWRFRLNRRIFLAKFETQKIPDIVPGAMTIYILWVTSLHWFKETIEHTNRIVMHFSHCVYGFIASKTPAKMLLSNSKSY